MARFLEEVLLERGYQLDEPVTVEGQDYDVVREFLAARDLARRVESGRGDAEDVEAAYENLDEVFAYVVEDRAPP